MIFTDTFNRADNPSSLGSPWTTHVGQFGVESGDAVFTSGMVWPQNPLWVGGTSVALHCAATVDVGSADMVVEWDGAPATGHEVRYFRFTDVANTLGLFSSSANTDLLLLGRTTAGSEHVISSTTSSGWLEKRVRVETLGTAVDVYVDGVLTLSATTSNQLTATRAGIGGNPIGWEPATFSDSFTRADASTLGSPWDDSVSGYGIDTNRAKSTYTGFSDLYMATVDLGSPIQTCEWEWSALEKGPTYHVFRVKSTTKLFFVAGTGGSATTLYLFERAGSGSDLLRATATGVTWGPGHVLRVEAGETDIKVYVDGSLEITYATSTAPYGSRAGLGAARVSGNTLIDNTRWTRFSGQGHATNTALESLGSVGPWLSDIHWTRFHCSPWPVPPPGGWSVGFIKF